MDWSFRKNWDEFTWSREIRKDELRISGYFRTLPTCLDLPGEDEMIFTRLMSQPELVPTGVADPLRMLKSEFEFAGDEEDSEEDNPRKNSFDAERRVKNLAIEWNLFAAYTLPVQCMQAVMGVTCAFGKLLSRIFNFVDTEEVDETLPLRISLLKRMLADLNELFESLNICHSAGAMNDCEMQKYQTALNLVREYIVDQIHNLRNGANC